MEKNFFGPAYNAERADALLAYLQDRESVTDPEQRAKMVLKMDNHVADPIGRLVGGNPGTGGVIPEGSSVWKEAIVALVGGNSVHNCYGSVNEKACKKLW